VPQPPLQRYFAIFRRTPSTRYLFLEEIETLRCAKQYEVDGFGGIHDWPTTIGGHLGCGLFVAKVMSIWENNTSDKITRVGGDGS